MHYITGGSQKWEETLKWNLAKNGCSCGNHDNRTSAKTFSELPPLPGIHANRQRLQFWLFACDWWCSPSSSNVNQVWTFTPLSIFTKYDRDGLADQLLGRRPEVEEQRQDRQDSIKFWAAQKPDLHPGTVERLQAVAPGSGAPASPPHPHPTPL